VLTVIAAQRRPMRTFLQIDRNSVIKLTLPPLQS
jgi:hypothetical protein